MNRRGTMRKRLVIGAAAVLLLAAMAAVAAIYLGNRREVTTSSEAAYKAYQEAMENQSRFYLKDAREGFARALELDPLFAEAMLGLARLSDEDQGRALVRRAAKQREHLTERERLHVDLMLAAREHKPDEVLRIARRLHDEYPSDNRAAMVLAQHEIEEGNGTKALEIFQETLAKQPNAADIYNQIGYFYGYRGEYEKAIENLKKYQFMAPEQANPYDSLGEIQAYSGHYDEAIANLNQALKLKPDFFESYRHLGVVYEGRGEPAKAIESYLKGAEMTFSDMMRLDFLRSAARVAWREGDLPKVHEIFARIEALPKDKYADINQAGRQAILALLEGRPAQAEATLRELKPKLQTLLGGEQSDSVKKFYDPAWNYLLTRALLAQGKVADAVPVLQEMASPPKSWTSFEERRWVYEGRALLAEILARQGDLDGAEKLLAENHKWNASWAPSRASELVVTQMRREKVLAASK